MSTIILTGGGALIKNIVLTVLLLALVVYTIILIIDSISLISESFSMIDFAESEREKYDWGGYELTVTSAKNIIKANIFKLIYYSAVIFICGLSPH